MRSQMLLQKGNILTVSYYLAIGYFSYLMLLITLQYIPINFDVAFLRLKQNEIARVHYQYAFFFHVYASFVVLITGISQFSDYLRARYKTFHRMLGKMYVVLVLLVASPSGLIMAFYANGGISSQLSFTIMAVLWFFFTYKAYQYARNRKWTLHKKFMLRSYALTLSAISLRLFKWIIVSTVAWPPMDTYRFVAWAGWMVNLLVIEIYFVSKIHSR